MNYLKTEAIVLNGFKYGDTSKIVTIYTLLDGKFSVLIKGARNTKSNLGGIFENLNHIDIFYTRKPNRNLQSIYKAESISTFSSVKTSLEKISVAYKILELTSKITVEFDQSVELFHLLKDSLYTLNSTFKNFSLVYLLYQVKLTGIIGIDPYFQRNFVEEIYVMDSGKQKHRNFVLNNSQIDYINKAMDTEDVNNFESVDDISETISEIYDTYIFTYSEKPGVSNSRKVTDELKKDNLI